MINIWIYTHNPHRHPDVQTEWRVRCMVYLQQRRNFTHALHLRALLLRDNTQSNIQRGYVRRVCYTSSQHATSQLPRPRLSVPAILGHAYVPCGGIGDALLMCSPWR